jgi:hypothetical protein
MDSEKRENSINYLNNRWRQLYELEKEWGEKAVNFLFLTNSGGAIATLSFLGSDNELTIIQYLNFKVSLILFVIGVFFVGVTIARAYHHMLNLFEGYKKDANSFLVDLVAWKHLCDEDDARVSSIQLQYVPPYASFICFVAGCIFGGYGLFGQ